MVRVSMVRGDLPPAALLQQLQALRAETFGGDREELAGAAAISLQGLKALFDAARAAEASASELRAARGSGWAHDGANDSESESENDSENDSEKKSRKRRRPVASGRLDELPVEGFDAEQLWAMLDMDNKPTMKYLEDAVEKLTEAGREAPIRITIEDNASEEEDSEEEDDGDDDEDEYSGEEDEDMEMDLEEMIKAKKGAKKQNKAIEESEEEEEDEEEEEEDDDEDEDEEEKKVASGEESEDEENDLNMPTEMDDDFFAFAEMEKFTSGIEDEDVKYKLKQMQREKKQKEQDVKEARKSVGKKDDDDYSDDGAVDEANMFDDEDEDDNDGSSIDLEEADGDDSEDEGRHTMFSDFWGKGSKKTKTPAAASAKKQKHSKIEDDDEDDDEEEEGSDEEEVSDEDEAEMDVSDEEGEGLDELEGEEEDEKVEPKEVRLSTHEKQQLALREQIEELEQELVGEKDWEMTGEASGHSRPQNALLEKGAEIQVDYLSRPAPAITEEVTRSLEDRIKQRILDGDYDDVERKLPMEKDADYRPKAELSMEKSKVGLGEEYAQAYEQQVMGHASESETALSKEHEELHNMFTALCHKLDSLSNFHYTPKPPTLEGEVTPMNTASIEMEEAMPVAMSSATQAAPEQVLAAKKGREGVGRTREEMDQEERKRIRQANKTAKRKRQRQRDAEKRVVSRLNPGLGNKHAKKAAAKVASGAAPEGDNTKWTKSSSFFAKMQQNTQDAAAAQRKGADKSNKNNSSKTAQLRL